MTSKSSYEAPAAEFAELFADYLEGDGSRPAFVLSRKLLGAEARNALEKSFAAFGYEGDSITYATLSPHTQNTEGSDVILDANAIFSLIEALDPLFVIAADTEAIALLAQAYRCDLPITDASPARIFGRSAATFNNLSELLTTEIGKQSAWRTLKSLVG